MQMRMESHIKGWLMVVVFDRVWECSVVYEERARVLTSNHILDLGHALVPLFCPGELNY